MPLEDRAPTWLDPWFEHNFALLSADLQQKILAERERWRAEVEATQRAREAVLSRLVTSVDVITSAAIPDRPFYALNDAVEITARAIVEALHDIPAGDAHTSEYWSDTLSKHRERLCALAELGKLTVFDVRTASVCMVEFEPPDWKNCENLGLTRSGMVDFARCQGIDVMGAQEAEHKRTKKQNTMLRVVAALIYLRNEPPSDLAISKEVETWTQLREMNVSARTVTNYITEIGEALGLSRKELGLTDREDAPN